MSLAQTTFGDVLDRCMADDKATIASLRALLATATNEIEQLTTTIDEKWVEQIDALTKENKELKEELDVWVNPTGEVVMNQEGMMLYESTQEENDELKEENKKLKKENSVRAACFDIVKDENEVNKKNLKKMLMERPPLKSADIEQPEKENTKNEKGHRLVVQTEYDQLVAYFKIPDGVDLEDKSVVESWGTKYGTLYIKYVGKAEEEEIEWLFDPSECEDYKSGGESIVDADDACVEYSDDEE